MRLNFYFEWPFYDVEGEQLLPTSNYTHLITSAKLYKLCKEIYPEIEIIPKLREEAKYVVKGSPESKTLWKQILQTEGQVQRNSMNSPIQGSGADITKEALIGVRELIITYNNTYKEDVAYLICTVHDAIDVEVREDLATQFAKEMEDIMINAGNKYVSKVQMKVDTTITKEWIK